ncbi:endonuclease domain-containing protein [Agromyces sp. NPDC056965]|uniref:endonuclease domain-containing protein n=1 Tax=Agromyces sp. NPDC056965 TaxID=3345983 RepID=UPI003640B251
MRRPTPLPEEFASLTAFAEAEARRAGASRRRLAASDLVTPFRGARLDAGSERTVATLAAAYARRMPPTQFFSHATAALLNHVPLPLRVESDTRLHVSVLRGAPQPRVRGVIGHQLDRGRTRLNVADGVAMTDPVTTWCQLGILLGIDDLVAAGDFLVTGHAGPRGTRPAATVPMLTAGVARHHGSPGARRLRAALPLVRSGPLSRRESLLRLRIVAAGLPEPLLNFTIVDPRLGAYPPTVDLAYPEYRVGIEYEGDYHRTTEQFRRDIRRYERIQDIGWSVIRVSARDVPDLDSAASRETTDRIAARLRQHGWVG